MKKYLPFLLIFALIFTSCSGIKKNSDNNIDKNTTSTNSIPEKPNESHENDISTTVDNSPPKKPQNTESSNDSTPSGESSNNQKPGNNENQNTSQKAAPPTEPDSTNTENSSSQKASNNTSNPRPIPCSTAMDHAMDDMEALLGIEAMRQLYGATDNDELPVSMYDSLEQILRTWYTNSINSQLKKGESDETVIDCATIEFNSWQSYLQLLGLEDRFSNEIQDSYNSIAKGINNAIDKAAEKCATQHDFSQVSVMFYYLAQLQLRGFNKEDYGVYDDSDIYDKIVSVTSLELHFDSQFELTEDGELAALARVKSDIIPLTLVVEEMPNMVWKGFGPLNYVQFEIPDDDGTITTTTKDSTFEVIACWISLPTAQVGCTHCGKNASDNSQNNDQLQPNIRMVINPGNPSETITIKDDDFSMTIPFSYGWFAMFGEMHKKDYIKFNEPFVSLPPIVEGIQITDWDMGGPGLRVIARKIFDTSGPNGINEITTFDLYHSPR